MTYISSGKFRADLEETTGQTLVRDDEESDGDDENDDEESEEEEFSMEGFDPEVRVELEALAELCEHWSPPRLCVLHWGDFCPSPYQNGADRDEVLEEWFRGDEAATDFVMDAVSVVHGGGGFYILVNRDGRLGLLCEDPHSFKLLECTLPQFLQALLAAHRAVCTQGLDAAKQELSKVVGPSGAKLLLTFAGRLAPSTV